VGFRFLAYNRVSRLPRLVPIRSAKASPRRGVEREDQRR
jgi:hypothetical protein